jgi:hypothetical protein
VVRAAVEEGRLGGGEIILGGEAETLRLFSRSRARLTGLLRLMMMMPMTSSFLHFLFLSFPRSYTPGWIYDAAIFLSLGRADGL